MQKQKTSIFTRTFAVQAVLPCLLAVAAAFVAWFQLELSDAVTAGYLLGQLPVYALLNALTAFCLTLAVYLFAGRWFVSTGVSGAVWTILAIVNYYTRDLHGSAVMPQDVLNLGTAAEVMGSYTLHVDAKVAGIALLYLPVLALAFVQARLERGRRGVRASWPARLRRAACSLAGAFAILYLGYFSPWPVMPVGDYGWNWQPTYYTYGFLAGTVRATSLLADPVIRPADATEETAADALALAAEYEPAAAEADPQDYPDIVMILSESFYDISLVTDPQADIDYLANLHGLENSIQGHVVSPHIGGGTNHSEYEMLTSNSLMLAPAVTPYNWLDLDGAESIVSYLKDLGYATLAAHPYTGSNYNRDTAWVRLGFDETHFAESFPTRESYGDRPYQTDSATYRDLEALYEAMPEDQPRFAFLVSIQTHGDYDMNAPELDLVHAAADYGRYDAEVDEYLSCIALSDQAIGELCDYFTQVYEETGRRVIVCLAGDHAPSFIDHIADHDGISDNDLWMLERSTPYFIWANYPLENAGQASEADSCSRMDLCDLAPTLAEQAGLPLSDYYRYILNMKQDILVQTGGCDYMDETGVLRAYGSDPADDALLRGYFALEYGRIANLK